MPPNCCCWPHPTPPPPAPRPGAPRAAQRVPSTPQGTHGRWKYVAAVPLLPFLMSSVYLLYGFLAYPIGFADLKPLNISWDK